MKVYNFFKKTGKKGWTRGVYSRNKYGHQVYTSSKNACRFCLLGAINRFYPHESKFYIYRNRVAKILGDVNIANFNDDPTTKFEDILRVCKKAKV